MDFILRIESRLLSPAILSGNRILKTMPAPAFCQAVPAEYFEAIEGNKLYKLAYYLENLSSLPPAKRIWSYGSAQSNAMLALSALAQLMGTEFHYVLPYIADELKTQPKGNLALALDRGMQLHIDSKLYRRMTQQAFVPGDDEWIFAEGANHAHAAHGFGYLGNEIAEVGNTLEFRQVFLPSGTGTSACHLAALMPEIAVTTTPVYGDTPYLQQVFSTLPQQNHPAILTHEPHYRFGSLYRELWELQAELATETGISFDLLYDLPAWACILQHREHFKQPWLYLHQGGMKGSATMRERYVRMFGAERPVKVGA
ncbi:1-aminocyclopropane-1-carboxylate deaminase [Methylobacillus flagellatus]|uniref:hypothetical protein n=1 Tax=Methylobacillus flagellatus TaxID=405 RepID=UPI002853F40E|nr:hypothetical protein [Methylobacillus flagellatus]MDR5172039.1 1-aminocyclopropane-1-carboxylate deaminase [Methylobacillus flagellatus]